MVIIKSRQDGFRRCGVAHSVLAVAWPDGTFTDEEVAILCNEPMLMVTVVNDSETDSETGLDSKKPAKVKPE